MNNRKIIAYVLLYLCALISGYMISGGSVSYILPALSFMPLLIALNLFERISSQPLSKKKKNFNFISSVIIFVVTATILSVM